jgi:hypothetical protein
VDANKDAAVFNTKITGLSLTAMSEALKTALKTALCTSFEASGVADQVCTVLLSAGSVKATITVTGNSLGALKTPTAANVQAAVMAVQDIETAKQGNQPIGVAAVSGVVFKAGQTAATVVPPPTAPSPPPTPTSPTAAGEGEDVDASYRSTVFVALAIVFSVAWAN